MTTGTGTRPAAGKDPVSVDPTHYKVEIDNEQYRVLRVQYGRNEKSTMHSHPHGVMICLTDIRARFTFPDGSNEERYMKSGDVAEIRAEEHLPENLGDAMEVILVEIKA